MTRTESVEPSESVGDFRARARDWLARHAPREDLSTDLPAARAWQARLAAAGFAAITWPTRYGGAGLSTGHARAFHEQALAYPLPTDPFAVGFGMCGPTLLELGTPEQRGEHLPPLVTGDRIWCQLFSEPGAGSDVAGLRTRATADGSGWVVTGQKVWTSRAQYAERGMLLARTAWDVPKHRGLTMFILDMHAPGVTVRPLRDMTGGARFNEVWLDEVRLPAAAVLGPVGGGWTVATAMLRHERVAIGTQVRPRFPELGYPALRQFAGGVPDDPVLRRDLARHYVRERAVELLGAALEADARAGREVGARGSIAKLAAAEVTERAAALAVRLAGDTALGWTDEEAPDRRPLVTALDAAPSTAIAGGTSEIQRNIIGERVLGLGREPQVDKDVPFREVISGKAAR